MEMAVSGRGCQGLWVPWVVEPSRALARARGLAERDKASLAFTLEVAIAPCSLITIMLLPELSPLT